MEDLPDSTFFQEGNMSQDKAEEIYTENVVNLDWYRRQKMLKKLEEFRKTGTSLKLIRQKPSDVKDDRLRHEVGKILKFSPDDSQKNIKH